MNTAKPIWKQLSLHETSKLYTESASSIWSLQIPYGKSQVHINLPNPIYSWRPIWNKAARPIWNQQKYRI